nr:unnamed protein product [Callosobruchus chinensis]
MGSLNKYTHYYWRDYTGEVPCDAVVGGYDEQNRTTYIGQGFGMFNGYYSLSPVTIIEGERRQRASISGIGIEVGQTRILCATSPNPDKWIKTNSRDLVTDTADEQMILGGIEGKKDISLIRYDLNIGRAKLGNKLVTGKIVTFSDNNSALFVLDGWFTREIKDDFEVLVANN